MLRHLGIAPGDKLDVQKLPDGRVSLQATRPQGTMADFIGFLKGETDEVATLEEIKAAIEAGRSGSVQD